MLGDINVSWRGRVQQARNAPQQNRRDQEQYLHWWATNHRWNIHRVFWGSGGFRRSPLHRSPLSQKVLRGCWSKGGGHIDPDAL